MLKAGIVSYEAGLKVQDAARDFVAKGVFDGVLILLEHYPVITVGKAGGADNVRISSRDMKERGIEIFHSSRGGNVTCHSPGQLVGYPILNLSCWQEDIHWYVRTLEDLLIRVLQDFTLRGEQKAPYSGVWIRDKKVAAIGVSARSWITGHGFALNVCNDLNLFQEIVPCGIREFGVTSISNAKGQQVEVSSAENLLTQSFKNVFECTLETIKLQPR